VIEQAFPALCSVLSDAEECVSESVFDSETHFEPLTHALRQKLFSSSRFARMPMFAMAFVGLAFTRVTLAGSAFT
jgi:hypothetical protein